MPRDDDDNMSENYKAFLERTTPGLSKFAELMQAGVTTKKVANRMAISGKAAKRLWDHYDNLGAAAWHVAYIIHHFGAEVAKDLVQVVFDDFGTGFRERGENPTRRV
jgi:hypothetical protein